MKPKIEILIEHMQAVEQAVSQDKGVFTLYSLFEREDLSDRWDLVVSAPWLRPRREDILPITLAMSQHLNSDEMVLIARIVPVPVDSDFVRDVFRDMNGKAALNVGGYTLLDWPHMSGESWMGRGYILTPRMEVEEVRPVSAAA
jgi:hypothetical protein